MHVSRAVCCAVAALLACARPHQEAPPPLESGGPSDEDGGAATNQSADADAGAPRAGPCGGLDLTTLARAPHVDLPLAPNAGVRSVLIDGQGNILHVVRSTPDLDEYEVLAIDPPGTVRIERPLFTPPFPAYEGFLLPLQGGGFMAVVEPDGTSYDLLRFDGRANGLGQLHLANFGPSKTSWADLQDGTIAIAQATSENGELVLALQFVNQRMAPTFTVPLGRQVWSAANLPDVTIAPDARDNLLVQAMHPWLTVPRGTQWLDRTGRSLAPPAHSPRGLSGTWWPQQRFADGVLLYVGDGYTPDIFRFLANPAAPQTHAGRPPAPSHYAVVAGGGAIAVWGSWLLDSGRVVIQAAPPDSILFLDAASGAACGTVQLPGPDVASNIDIGLDGTVVQTGIAVARLWPRLLR